MIEFIWEERGKQSGEILFHRCWLLAVCWQWWRSPESKEEDAPEEREGNLSLEQVWVQSFHYTLGSDYLTTTIGIIKYHLITTYTYQVSQRCKFILLFQLPPTSRFDKKQQTARIRPTSKSCLARSTLSSDIEMDRGTQIS